MQKLSHNLLLIVTGILLVVSFGLRLHFANTLELWYDEAFTGLTVANDWGDLWQTVQEDKVHPPLAYLLQKVSVDVFGNTSFVIRLPSLVAGLAVMIVTYWLVLKSTGNKLATFLATAMVSLSPLFVLYSVEARSYMQLSLLSLLWTFAVYYFTHRKQKIFAILLVLTVLLLFTHLFSVFWVAAGWIYIISFALDNKKTHELISKLKAYWALSLPIGVLGLSAIAWIGAIIAKPIRPNFGWLPTSVDLHSVADLIYSYLFGVDTHAPGFSEPFSSTVSLNPALVVIVLIILILIGLPKLEKTQKKLAYTLIWMSVVPILFGYLASDALGLNLLLPRYFIMSAPAFLILLGLVISTFRRFNLVIVVATIVAVALSHEFTITTIGYPGKADLAENVATSHDFVGTYSAMDFVVLKYYLRNTEAETNFVLLSYVDSSEWALINESEIRTDLDPSTDRVFVIE